MGLCVAVLHSSWELYTMINFNSLSDYDKGWVVGIIEGEGSPTVCNGRPRVACNMCDKDTIERLQTLVPAQANIYHYPGRRGNHKDTYHWVYEGKKALLLMMDLFPYLSQRRQQQIQEIVLKHG